MKSSKVTFFNPREESPFPSGPAASGTGPSSASPPLPALRRRVRPNGIYQYQLESFRSGALQQPQVQSDGAPALNVRPQTNTANTSIFDYETQMNHLHSDPAIRRQATITTQSNIEDEQTREKQDVKRNRIQAMARLDPRFERWMAKRDFINTQKAAATSGSTLDDADEMARLDLEHQQGIARRELLQSQGMAYNREITTHGGNINTSYNTPMHPNNSQEWDAFENSNSRSDAIRYYQMYGNAVQPRNGAQHIEATSTNTKHRDFAIYNDTQKNHTERFDHLYHPPQESETAHLYGGDTLYHYRAQDGTMQPRNAFQDPEATYADNSNITMAEQNQRAQPRRVDPLRRNRKQNINNIRYGNDTQVRNCEEAKEASASQQNTSMPENKKPTMHEQMMASLRIKKNSDTNHPVGAYTNANFMRSEHVELHRGQIKTNQNQNGYENSGGSPTGQNTTITRAEQQRQLEQMFTSVPMSGTESSLSSSINTGTKSESSAHYRNHHGYIVQRNNTGDSGDSSSSHKMPSFALNRSPTGMIHSPTSNYSSEQYTDVSVHTIGTPGAGNAEHTGIHQEEIQNGNVEKLGGGEFQAYTTQNGDLGQAYGYEAHSAGPPPATNLEQLKSKQSAPQLATLKSKKSFWDKFRRNKPKSLESIAGTIKGNEPNSAEKSGPIWSSTDSTKVGNSFESGNSGIAAPLANSQPREAFEPSHIPASRNIIYDGSDPELERVRNKQSEKHTGNNAPLGQPNINSRKAQGPKPVPRHCPLSDLPRFIKNTTHTCKLPAKDCNVLDSIVRVKVQIEVINELVAEAAKTTELKFKLSKIKNHNQRPLRAKLYEEIKTLGERFKQAMCAVEHEKDTLTTIQLERIHVAFSAVSRKLLTVFSGVGNLALDKHTPKRFKPFNKGIAHELGRTKNDLQKWVDLLDPILYPVPRGINKVKIGIQWSAIQKGVMAHEMWEKLRGCDGL